MDIYRQGDVIFMKINTTIHGYQKNHQTKKKIILAEGEVTGHAHVIEDFENAFLRESNNRQLLDVFNPVEVLHEEHAKITLPKGRYEVRIQREFDPEIREYRVAD